MAFLDAYDDVLLRALVGRFVNQMEASVDRRVVLAAPLSGCAPGWSLASHGPALAIRRERALGLLMTFGSMGVLDVRNFFVEVSPQVVFNELSRLPGTRWCKQTLAALVSWLDVLAKEYGVPGLPIGHDSSSVIGNYLLQCGDQALKDVGIKFLRYMDDTWVFPSPSVEFQEIAELYGEAVDELGVELNESKSKLLHPLAALEEIESTLISYAFDTSAVMDPEQEEDRAVNLLEVAIEDPLRYGRELRKALGVLTTHRSLSPLSYLVENIDLFRFGPDSWCRYLEVMCDEKKSRKHIDPDWLIEVATQSSTPEKVHRRILALRAASRMRLPRSSKKRLLEMVTGSEDWATPARVLAARACGQADGWKPKEALDHLEGVREFSTRRALALTLKDKSSRSQRKALLDWARRHDPDLVPTARFVAA